MTKTAEEGRNYHYSLSLGEPEEALISASGEQPKNQRFLSLDQMHS